MNFRIEDDHVEVEAQVDTVDRTGVEMEALTACAIAALTIYDMCKSIDRAMTIGELDALGEDRRPLRHLPPSAAPRRRRTRPLTGLPDRHSVADAEVENRFEGESGSTDCCRKAVCPCR